MVETSEAEIEDLRIRELTVVVYDVQLSVSKYHLGRELESWSPVKKAVML